MAYNPAIPPEFFDVVFVDECHRSIYMVWRQVLDYFDGHLVGLTATPAKHTFGFFNQNLVMEYGHEEAVADRVNVDFEVYRIRTSISAQGSTIDASGEPVLGVRDRRTRTVRWESRVAAEDLPARGSERSEQPTPPRHLALGPKFRSGPPGVGSWRSSPTDCGVARNAEGSSP